MNVSSNVHYFFFFFFCSPPLSDGCCDAVISEEEWKHTSAHSLLMMLISSQSKTCKWNVWTQLSKLCYGGGGGGGGGVHLGQSVWIKKKKKLERERERERERDSTQLVTSPPDFVFTLRPVERLVHPNINNNSPDAAFGARFNLACELLKVLEIWI